MSSSTMVDTTVGSSGDPSCSSCAKLKEALEASKKEHSLTLRMVKEKIISTDELIKKYQQKCHESDKHQQQSTDSALKLEAAQMKIESLQSQLERALHSSEPLRKNVARLHREKSLADSTISELREKLQNFEKMNSELLSTAKIKEEQECAWRLEKQVQAHEMQKQKKSLQKSEATIAKLQEEVKKAKEENKEVKKLLSQAKRKAVKMEQQLQKSKEEIQSVKLEAEFAKALGDDLTKKTTKPRQRQKARQPPRQLPVEPKQTTPSASHPSQPLTHIIDELAMLSDMEPALSPLPPSPDRGELGDSSSSEKESGNGSSSEDDGSGNEDEDSDYSLGDLADMLIGDHGEGENLAVSPMKTRSSDQDIHEDVKNSAGQETTTKNDVDWEKTESESSVRHSPNKASASDIEVSENLSLANCNVVNPGDETSKCLTMTQEGSIEVEVNENSHIAESDCSGRKKTDDESGKTEEPSNAEKYTVVTPSPQRKAKRRMASPKPRVITRSRAKAMKISSSSDAESSSERETTLDVISTQENCSEVSDSAGLTLNSNVSDVRKSNDGGSGDNEHVSVALVNNTKEFTKRSQANEFKEHVEERFQGFLSDSSNFDADDASHHHGNLCELVSSAASQEPTEDNSNVLVAMDTDVIHQQKKDGELSCSRTLVTDSGNQGSNEANSNVLLVGMDKDVIHIQRNDGQLSCSTALLSDSEKQVGNEDNLNVSEVGLDTDVIHQQRNDGQLSCSGTLLTDSEEQVGNGDISNALAVGMYTDAVHQQRNDGQLFCSAALHTDPEKQAGNDDNSNVSVVGLDTDFIHQQRNDVKLSCSEAVLTDSEEQVGNEDISNALSAGMDTDVIHQQRNDGQLGCSAALPIDSEKQAGNEDNSNVSVVGLDTDFIHQQGNDIKLICSGAILTDSEEQVGNEDNSNALSVLIDTDVIHQQRNDRQLSCSGALLTDSEEQVGNDDISIALSAGMDTDVIHQQRNDGQLGCSAALPTDSEKQTHNDDSSNVSVVGLDADVIHQQRNNSQLSCSTPLLTDSEKQAGNKDNSNVLLERTDCQLSCSGTLLTDTQEQAGNEDGNSNVFTGGQEADCSRLDHSTALLSEQVANEDNSDVSLAPVSKATENVPTEAGIEIDQEISTTSKCASEFKGDAPVNMTKEENPNINEIPFLELKNESVDSILANKIINEKNTEESQTSHDSKITADFNGNTLPLQLQTKKKAFKRREDTFEENKSNVSEDFEPSPEQLEVGSSVVVDTDSSDQTQSFVCKTQNQSICETESKSSGVSELSTTCYGTKNEDRSRKQVDFPSDEKIDADSFSCNACGKSTASTPVETSQGDTADVSSSTVEVNFNISTLSCENKTTIATTSATETAESCSTKSHGDEPSEDNKLILEAGGPLHATDEAMQSCSIDEHEGKASEGQDSDIQENIPVLTPESLRKNSELEKDESFSSDGKELLTCNEGTKNSVWVKDVLSSETLIKKASEPSTSNEIRKESDCVRDVPAFKTAIKEAREPSTFNGGKKNSDYVKDVRSFKTVIEEASEPSTSSERRKESDSEKDVSSEHSSSITNGEKRRFDKKNDLSSRVMSKGSSSTVNEGRKHSDMARDVWITIGKESCSTFNEGKRNSPLGRGVSSRDIFRESPAASIQRKRSSTLERNVSSRAMNKESCSTFNEGRKLVDMGRDVPCTAMAKESCLTVGRGVSSRAGFCESPLTSTKGKTNSALEKKLSSRAGGNESSSTFYMGKRNSDLGRDVFSRITSKEGFSSNEKEILSFVDVRVPSTFNKERKQFVINRDVSSCTTVAEQAGERKSLSSSLLDAEESKLEERGLSSELPSSPTGEGPFDDFPVVGELMDDSPIQTLFNNLEGLLDEFPALSPLPPSPRRSDDEECSTSPISSSILSKEKSNRVTDLTSAKKTCDVHGKWEFKRDRTVNYTEVASSRSVKRIPLEKSATICITESNKMNISVKPRNPFAEESTSKSVSTTCSRGSSSIKRPLQRSESAPPRAEEIVSRKRSHQQSVYEPVNNNNAVSQKSKKMRTQPKIPRKVETSSLETRLDISRVPVEKATSSQQSKNNGATNRPEMVDRKGPILADTKLAGNKGPVLAGTKVPILAGKKAPKLAGNKGPMLTGSKEPIRVGDDGPIVDFNEGPVLEEGSKYTNNSAKTTGNKRSKYPPLSVRPSYMPEVKYVFRCLSRIHEDNVDLHVVVDRLTTKRCISSSTPVASAIIQFLKEREDDLIPQVLDQLEHFQTGVSLNNWQPVISSFESRLLEVISLLSNDSLFGNVIPRLISLCSRSLTETRCSATDEEVVKRNLSVCRILTALCQLKKNLDCARTVCYDVIRTLYGSQNAALELVGTMVTVWPEVLKTFSGKQSPLAQTLKLLLLYWAQTSPSADLGNILRVLCCWEDDLVTEDVLRRFGLQLIQPLREEGVGANVVLCKDGSMALDGHSFEVIKSLELLSCVLGWQWTLNELVVNNVWQILKSWAEKETRDEPTANESQPQAASSSEEYRGSACCCRDFNVSSEVSSVTVLAEEGTSDRSGFITVGEEKEERNRVGDEELPEICSKCGKQMGTRLPESQAVLCIQLLGVLCRIAIDNGQTPVREIPDMFCGLMEDWSPFSTSKVTYAIQLASAVALLDMSPWQPERVAAVLGKWVAALKDSGSPQAPAYVTQGLVCLKSFLRINQI